MPGAEAAGLQAPAAAASATPCSAWAFMMCSLAAGSLSSGPEAARGQPQPCPAPTQHSMMIMVVRASFALPCLSEHACLAMQVVQALARARMLGDGDVLRHLGAQGYRLAHAQDPRQEQDFSVTSLAADLRSGLRLCRLVELLAGAGLLCLDAWGRDYGLNAEPWTQRNSRRRRSA